MLDLLVGIPHGGCGLRTDHMTQAYGRQDGDVLAREADVVERHEDRPVIERQAHVLVQIAMSEFVEV